MKFEIDKQTINDLDKFLKKKEGSIYFAFTNVVSLLRKYRR